MSGDVRGERVSQEQVDEEKELILREEDQVQSHQLPTVVILPTRRTKNKASSDPDSSAQGVEQPQVKTGCDLSGIPALKRLCGLQPVKVVGFATAVIAVWVTWMFIMHLNIKIEHLTVLLEENTRDLRKVQEAVVDERSNQDTKERRIYGKLTEILSRLSKDDDGDKSEKVVNKENAIEDIGEPNRVDTEEVLMERCTKDGRKCILPFLFKDKLRTDCVNRWMDKGPWCPTAMQPGGVFVDTGSNWGYCGEC